MHQPYKWCLTHFDDQWFRSDSVCIYYSAVMHHKYPPLSSFFLLSTDSVDAIAHLHRSTATARPLPYQRYCHCRAPLPHLHPHLASIVSVLRARSCGEVDRQWPVVVAAATSFNEALFSSLRVSLPWFLTFSLALVLCFVDSFMRALWALIAMYSGEGDSKGRWGGGKALMGGAVWCWCAGCTLQRHRRLR